LKNKNGSIKRYKETVIDMLQNEQRGSYLVQEFIIIIILFSSPVIGSPCVAAW
jgi:hypothetical protein